MKLCRGGAWVRGHAEEEPGYEATRRRNLGMKLCRGGAWVRGHAEEEPGYEATRRRSLGTRPRGGGAWVRGHAEEEPGYEATRRRSLGTRPRGGGAWVRGHAEEEPGYEARNWLNVSPLRYGEITNIQSCRMYILMCYLHTFQTTHSTSGGGVLSCCSLRPELAGLVWGSVPVFIR